MDTEEFIFPFYFKNYINFNFFLFLCPFRFVKRRETEKIATESNWFQKLICIGLQGTTLLFGLVAITTFVFINLRRYPTQLFRLTNESLNFATTVTVLYTAWFKRRELLAIAEIPTGRIKRRHKTIFFAFFILLPVLTLSFEAVLIIKSILNPANRQTAAYAILTVTYLRPHNHIPSPEQIKFEPWERLFGLVLFIVTRFAFVIATFRPIMVLFTGFALQEINSRLSEVIDDIKEKGNCQLLPKIIKHFKVEYLSKVRSVFQPLMTVHVVVVYATLSRDLVLLADYPMYKLGFAVVSIMFMITVLLKNAQATSVAKKVQKKLLLCDERVMNSASIFSPADVSLIKSIDDFGSSGFISVIHYGSLGLAFGVAVQFAIMMLQFLGEEKKVAKNTR